MDDRPYELAKRQRRLARVVVSREWLVQLMREGLEFTGVRATTRGIPKDAVFSHAFTNNFRGDVSFVFAHESFDPVEMGEEIPEIEVIFEVLEYEEGKADDEVVEV